MGFWINIDNGYSSGPRHYCDLPPIRSTPVAGSSGPDWLVFTEIAGPTLCGKNLQNNGGMTRGPARQHSETGGLSAVPVVNLLQSNLCGSCVRAYLTAHPSLATAVEAVKRIRIDSI
jgi:hypothetical protein